MLEYDEMKQIPLWTLNFENCVRIHTLSLRNTILVFGNSSKEIFNSQTKSVR